MSDCETCGYSEEAESQNDAALVEKFYETIYEKDKEIAALQEQLDIARDIARLLKVRTPRMVDGRTESVIASWPTEGAGRTLVPGYGETP